MRRVLVLLLIAAAVGGTALAQTAKPTRVVAQSPAGVQAQNDSPALPPPLIPLTGASQGRDPDQCRSSCNRTYFFCRANGDDDGCPTQWMQCKTRCTATYSPR
jgi:hypothetical protein